ncbi:unnamed protein product [Lactuca saligna]|uniref:Uncharacterized protein n=1 Tax=Lactuca saligna TaxID=75948 RepID=A0AA35ZL93_LACSI|nr:unnamed protein product [Lactuca saligna]
MLQLHTPIEVSDNLIRNNTGDCRQLDLPPLVCPQLLQCRSILSRQREIQRRRSTRRFPTSSQEEKGASPRFVSDSRLYGHPTICRIIEVNGSKDL